MGQGCVSMFLLCEWFPLALLMPHLSSTRTSTQPQGFEASKLLLITDSQNTFFYVDTKSHDTNKYVELPRTFQYLFLILQLPFRN